MAQQTISLSTRPFYCKSLFFQLRHQQIPMLALNLDHTLFDSTARTAASFQLLGQLLQALEILRNACNQRNALALASLGLSTDAHHTVTWGDRVRAATHTLDHRPTTAWTHAPLAGRVHQALIGIAFWDHKVSLID